MRNQVTIDLARLSGNLGLIRRRAEGRPVLAVVKANAYGHGAPRVARYLARLGCERLAVATADEALAVRAAGLRLPIHLLASTPSSDYDRALGEDFIFTVGSALEIERLASLARAAGSRETIHLEVDTGMGRSGCPPEEVEALARKISLCPELVLEGAMTHFPSSDDPTDPEGGLFAVEQVHALKHAAATMERVTGRRPVLHAANSGALVNVPGSLLDFVRPGGSLYGIATGPRTKELGTSPVLSWTSMVVQVREFGAGRTIGYGRACRLESRRRIATLAVGYGDGYSRAFGVGGSVLIAGRRAPIVGRISMDTMMVDVTDCGPVGVNDEVVLIGRCCDDAIAAAELAALGNCSPYEVACRIAARVPRVYLTA